MILAPSLIKEKFTEVKIYQIIRRGSTSQSRVGRLSYFKIINLNPCINIFNDSFILPVKYVQNSTQGRARRWGGGGGEALASGCQNYKFLRPVCMIRNDYWLFFVCICILKINWKREGGVRLLFCANFASHGPASTSHITLNKAACHYKYLIFISLNIWINGIINTILQSIPLLSMD